jgi:hypothetical protein
MAGTRHALEADELRREFLLAPAVACLFEDLLQCAHPLRFLQKQANGFLEVLHSFGFAAAAGGDIVIR